MYTNAEDFMEIRDNTLELSNRDILLELDTKITNTVWSIANYATHFILKTQTPSSIEQIKDSIIVARHDVNESSLSKESKEKFYEAIKESESKIKDIIGDNYWEDVPSDIKYTGNNTARKTYYHDRTSEATNKSENVNYKHAYAVALQLQLERMKIWEEIWSNIINTIVTTEKKDENSFFMHLGWSPVANIVIDLNNETYNIEKIDPYTFKIWWNLIIEAILNNIWIKFSNKWEKHFSYDFE